MMAWSFPESELGQIHSIQGLGHNHMLDKIMHILAFRAQLGDRDPASWLLPAWCPYSY